MSAEKKFRIRSSYLGVVYDPRLFKSTVTKVVAAVKAMRKKTPIDAIAFRGSSGAALAFIVGHKLGLSLLHVRKESSHTCDLVEGNLAAKKVLIIDDFIATGATINKIVVDLRASLPKAKVVGLLLYKATMGESSVRELAHMLPRTALVKTIVPAYPPYGDVD